MDIDAYPYSQTVATYAQNEVVAKTIDDKRETLLINACH